MLINKDVTTNELVKQIFSKNIHPYSKRLGFFHNLYLILFKKSPRDLNEGEFKHLKNKNKTISISMRHTDENNINHLNIQNSSQA
jgi:hypothetical protein